MNPSLPVLLILAIIFSCQSKKEKAASAESDTPELTPLAYTLDRPAARYDLPKELREISGLTYYRGTQLAAVQDELGEIHVFNYATGKVSDRLIFGPNGDYEGIEFVKGSFYILRSDGQIFIVRPGDDTFKAGDMLSNSSRQLQTLTLGLPEKTDVEGLGYDPKTDRLMIAIKELKGEPKKRYVYFYDFAKKVAWKGVALTPTKLEQEAGLTGKDAELKPSGVAVHPQTGELYLLASDGKKLLVLDRMGLIRSVARLEPADFRQPEGICFAPDGTLFIASEGKEGEGYILKFDYQPPVKP
ncbi:MAG: SdiA-regulated domain-containing protein [Cytophagaceae bacterium]|nr:SdiA-regulated domain-containing protein [Cytophagaceae bacterium]